MCRCWQWTQPEQRATTEQVEVATHLYAIYSKSMSAKGAMRMALDGALNVRWKNGSKVEVIGSNFEASNTSKVETSGHAESGQSQETDSTESLASTICTA